MASPDRFDGLEVDQHQARFAGTVELDPTDADNMSMDTTFMAVVVCTVSGATVTDNAKGEIVRTNKFKLDQFAVVRDGELMEKLHKALPNLAGPAPTPTDPQMFEPKADANGEAIAVPEPVETEASLLAEADVEEEVLPLPENGFGPVEEEDDEEVFSPGSDNRVTSTPGSVSEGELPPGRPTPGSQPRTYKDPALAGFLTER